MLTLAWGCDTSEKDYSIALKTHSIQSFENFLQEHPEGNWSDSARMHIAFIVADSVGESSKFDEFLEQYPLSSLSERVKFLYDSLTTINGGCLAESQQLPPEIESELNETIEKKSLKSLSEFLQKDSSDYKERARPQIQEVMKLAIANKTVGSSSLENIRVIYLPDTSSSKFSYELSLLRKLDWLRIEGEKEVAVFNHYHQSQTSIIKNVFSVYADMKKESGYLSDNAFSSIFNSRFDKASNRTINANTRKMKSIISIYNDLLKENILATIHALETFPSDVCAKEQYWEHLNTRLQKGKGIYLKVENSSLYSGSVSFSDSEKEEISESLNALFQGEKHDLIKKMIGELIEKLNSR